ncbi:MAG TPA: threonine ammonia-lyase [Campylobacterales bacterium]|nr:threonine ammonia-lyase [Campylobacterales bacterium]
MISVKDIWLAQSNLSEVLFKTPITPAPKLSKELGIGIYFKKENLQNTGSFKLRGAFNRISMLSEEDRNRGVVAASAGNHAQGVAFSGQYFNIPTTIVMPEQTPLTKVNGVKSYGADVILYGDCYDDAYNFALQYAKEKERIFIHPFEDREVIAGQGTIGLELLQSGIDFDAVIVPVGGGGLISGVATIIKSLRPDIDVIGVVSAGATALKESYEQGKPISKPVKTIADGIAVRDGSKITLEYMKKYVDEVVAVDDEEIAGAILFLLENHKIIVEGAGAVGVASLLYRKIDISKYKNIAVVISGGNIDVTMLSIIIEKGLIKSNRKLKLLVTLIDKPGSLLKLTEIFQKLKANIVQIGYDRTTTSIAYGDANVSIDLEIKGDEHRKAIEEELRKSGYKFQILS